MANIKLMACLAFTVLLVFLSGMPAFSAEKSSEVFDEIRFGGAVSIQNAHTHENGFFSEVTVFFDPFGAGLSTDSIGRLATPRINVGISVSDQRQASQLFAGFDWTANVTESIYAEAGFGGVLHNGSLIGNASGPSLGCHVLFHEYLGLGYRFDTHWNATALVSHSSHAGFCGNRNDGMTRAGLQVGYKF